MKESYVLECYTAQLKAEIFYNGWLARRVMDPGVSTAQLRLDAFTIEGVNTLELRLGAFEPDTAVDREPLCHFRLYKTFREEGAEQEEIASFRFTPEEHPLSPKTLSPVFTHTLRPGSAFGAWKWQDARLFMPEDESAVVALVADLHGRMARKDTDGVMALLEAKLHEIARSQEMDARAHFARSRRVFEHFFSDPLFRVAPLDPASIVLESSAGGRLVRATLANGAPPISGETLEDNLSFDVTVSHVDGKFTIVR